MNDTKRATNLRALTHTHKSKNKRIKSIIAIQCCYYISSTNAFSPGVGSVLDKNKKPRNNNGNSRSTHTTTTAKSILSLPSSSHSSATTTSTATTATAVTQSSSSALASSRTLLDNTRSSNGNHYKGVRGKRVLPAVVRSGRLVSNNNHHHHDVNHLLQKESFSTLMAQYNDEQELLSQQQYDDNDDIDIDAHDMDETERNTT